MAATTEHGLRLEVCRLHSLPECSEVRLYPTRRRQILVVAVLRRPLGRLACGMPARRGLMEHDDTVEKERKQFLEYLTGKFRTTPAGCWIWLRATNNGYPVMRWQGRKWLVHRLTYCLFRGEIPENFDVRQLCSNRSCIQPEHLNTVPRSQRIRQRPRAKKTHCLKGHPYNEENTRIVKRTTGTARVCRECARLRNRKTHCPKGHPFGQDVTATGQRICRICRPAPAPKRGNWNAKKTHCPRGHPYDEENTYRKPKGERVCRACRRQSVTKAEPFRDRVEL
jgi:HNH endonuclease